MEFSEHDWHFSTCLASPCCPQLSSFSFCNPIPPPVEKHWPSSQIPLLDAISTCCLYFILIIIVDTYRDHTQDCSKCFAWLFLWNAQITSWDKYYTHRTFRMQTLKTQGVTKSVHSWYMPQLRLKPGKIISRVSGVLESAHTSWKELIISISFQLCIQWYHVDSLK